MRRPYTLIAELTHRCPLACLYCSNPLDLAPREAELDTATWTQVFGEAAALGVMQVHLTGGEPLVRSDLEALVAAARAADLYVNLITSGVPLAQERLAALKARGLDHVQVSLQDVDEAGTAAVARVQAHGRKLEAARAVKALGLALTINVVLHRLNVERVPALIALAAELGAERLELAHTQYYAWARENRALLLPTRAQVEAAEAVVRAAREAHRGRMEIAYVMPDYHAGEPKACMGGWAARYILIAPDGAVLPCHAARVVPGLEFEDVRARPLADIWRDAPGLAAFRGEDWMKEPCRSCARRAVDLGGCRCQAALLTGDAAAADPVCRLSPHHERVQAALREAAEPPPAPVYRSRRNRLRLIS